jgi:uncharacterized protein
LSFQHGGTVQQGCDDRRSEGARFGRFFIGVGEVARSETNVPATLAIDPLTSYYSSMNRDDAIARIKQIEPAIRTLGASGLYLFGSTARNEAKPTSDVDIFIDKDPTKPFGLVVFFDIEEILESALGAKVDFTTRDALHPVLKADIERSAIRIL